MKTKGCATLANDEEPVSLYAWLEKEINDFNLFSDDDLLNIDKSIHDIRKSLKAMLAILLLYKTKFNQTLYLHWKSYLNATLKQYASLRESYVNLQTFNRLEGELKGLGKSDIVELRNDLESKYNSLVKENQRIKEIIQQLHGSIAKISIVINHFQVNSDLESLKKRHRKTFRKAQRIFKVLTLTSSSGNYHKFRKWSRYFYFQQSILNRAGLQKVSSKKYKLLHKLTEYLGDEHDLQLFYKYLKVHFTDLSQMARPIFSVKIKRLRKKILALYPKIYS